MPREQRLLKFFIRLTLPIVTLGGFGGVWGLVLAGMNSQQVLSSTWSENEHFRARVIRADSAQGCGYGASYVVVERAILHFKTSEFTPFCVRATGGPVSLQFPKPNLLVIRCAGCEPMAEYSEDSWGTLHFSYEWD